MARVREFNDMLLGDNGLYINDKSRNKNAENSIEYNKHVVIDGVLYKCNRVEVNDMIDMRNSCVRLSGLNNSEELLEKIRSSIQERFNVEVIYVDYLEKYVYNKSEYLYYSNGGVCCIFDKNDLVTICLSRDNMLNNVFPYHYSNECKYAVDYIKKFCGYKDGEYYEYYLDEPYTTDTRANFDNIKKERLVERRPSIKSARNM